jgi:hypothetical protein
MKKTLILATTLMVGVLCADSNLTESNLSVSKAKKEAQQLAEQIKKEEKFAKEQRFYQGEEYDLSSYEVDKSSLDSIPLIEPDYDFDMDDVYD